MDRAQEIINAWYKDEAAIILSSLSAVGEDDLDFLLSKLDNSGRGQFWKRVVEQLRPVFAGEILPPTPDNQSKE